MAVPLAYCISVTSFPNSSSPSVHSLAVGYDSDLLTVCNTVMTPWDLCPVCDTARHTARYTPVCAYRLHTPRYAIPPPLLVLYRVIPWGLYRCE
jgi:hypothetical protein